MQRTRRSFCGLEDYLACHDGPFFELQRQLGLLERRELRSGRRILVFVTLAFGVPLLLSVLEGHAWGASGSFLLDPRTWAKCAVAIAACILAEQQVETSLRTRLAQFTWAPLIRPESLGDAAEATARALKRRHSWLAEAVCLVLAVAATLYALLHLSVATTSNWAVAVTPDGASPTLAGMWCIAFSIPLFWFLLLRGLWRYLTIALLLRDIARLDLRLVATHPDGRGGLGFIADYPGAFSLFVFGVAAYLASGLASGAGHPELPPILFVAVAGTWLAFVLVIFLLPMLAFTPLLARMKKQTIYVTAPQATDYHRAVERRLLGRNILVDDELPNPGDERTEDPSKEFLAARKLSVTLVSGSALVPVVLAALLPFAAVGVDKLPYKEVFSIAKKLIVL